MQMASGTASGVSRSSDYRPFGYALTCTDTQAVHVGILCGVTIFFDDHIIPVIAVIRKYDEEINRILESLHELVDANEDADFVKQIHLIETLKGAGFLSAVSIMGEIGDFSAFSKPKQLFAYFGLDPAVKQSGKFEGTKVQMSKRGSAIARRVIHTLTLQSISISRNGEAKNPVLREYYLKKCDSKPKLVSMGAVSHKVCNMIFAILRDNKPFKIIAPQEHIKQYNAAKCDIAA